MTTVYLDAVGLTAPGLADWSAGADVLASRKPYRPDDLALRGSTLLPAGQYRDVLQHRLALVAESGRFDGTRLKHAAQRIDHQCG